jgi:hypothetical protein
MYQQLVSYIGKVHASKVGAYLGYQYSLYQYISNIYATTNIILPILPILTITTNTYYAPTNITNHITHSIIIRLGSSLAKQVPKIALWGAPAVILGGWMIAPAIKK